jgi:hypothetical protein
VYVDTKHRKIKDELESIHSRISVKIGNFDLNPPTDKKNNQRSCDTKGGIEEFYEKIKFFD